MAALDLINEASRDLETRMNELDLIVRVCDSVAGDNPPDWLALMFARVFDLNESVQAYMASVHEHALPLLRDIQGLSKPSKTRESM